MHFTIAEWVLGVSPIVVLLIGGWFFVNHVVAAQSQQTAMVQRATEALERIAAALEKRS